MTNGTPLKKKRGIKRIFGMAVLFLLLAVAGVLLFATATEYRPAEREAVAVEKNGEEMPDRAALQSGDTIRVLTWNTGYGALGDNADFFMDGGKMVYTADKTRAEQNLADIAAGIREQEADIVLLQEVDRDSARSFHMDEADMLRTSLQELPYSTFAWNFRTPFVPYPIPPIGKVSSGLLTLSAFPVTEAERIQLPCPFSWPVRTVNLKRCLSVHRLPVEGSGHELVIINLHLEAYDDGEGKAAQTDMLRDLLQKEQDAGNYVIAGGDFNQVFSNTDMSAWPVYEGKWQAGEIDAAAFPKGWQLMMDSTHPTCRSLDQPLAGADPDHFQYYVIDGFIFSANIEVRTMQTLDKGFASTDDNPVLAEAVLK